jgi:hypothetical protein
MRSTGPDEGEYKLGCKTFKALFRAGVSVSDMDINYILPLKP